MQVHEEHIAAKLEDAEMAEKSAVIALYVPQAEEAVSELQRSGIR